MQYPLIFDGHNDLLTRLMQAGGVGAIDTLLQSSDGAIDMPGAEAGGFGGGFFAIWVPSEIDASANTAAMQGDDGYDMPLLPEVPMEPARRVVETQMAILTALEEHGLVRVCRNVNELRDTLGSSAMAAICHMEGAEAIGTDMSGLGDLYARGLRSLGPVWSRPTRFGHGVPFRYPSGPDIGPGLTEAGQRLVTECDRLGIMLDLSHLNEAGFWEVARLSHRPLVATHSAAHAVCPHARNLTDAQLDAIAETDGMVGLAFACAFLRPDGKMRPDVVPDTILRHLDHLITRLGEDRVGFGSDFDGALVPYWLDNIAHLTRLRRALKDHGYDDALMEKLCHRNWFRVLEKSWA
ncbi:dipeptidase [Palleronia caenipelagi]|uniref:Peptidase M19 n=1 Tax=Palleronia caenipelagi TaxID=2489174 RepID=A0A547PXT2_9RHOB|nr:membrane dipeptidase [Palleronia caenipelagi]TRD18942.1 peptidase M19 [Palleronia caenipelagi]